LDFNEHDDIFGMGEVKKLPLHPLGGNYYSAGCRHWREPVRVGRFVVTCSALLSKTRLEPPTPDFGIYLHVGWKHILGASWTNGSYLKRLAMDRPYPALIVDWPDGGVIPVQQVADLVETCLSKLRQGKQIDIGCHGAHGRTGTLLACLIARIEHLDGAVALAEVRKRYCRWAVETTVQENCIKRYAEGKDNG
jgi:protein-tyrosine phosphatase